ncbi:MAG: cupin domain-containing protein [Pseudomonadota bacterium]
MIHWRTLLALLILTTGAAVQGKDLLSATRSWDGGEFEYPQGQPEVSSAILRIDEGQKLPFHCHPVPTMGYVLNGTVEVETRDGRKARFSAGDAVVEVMSTVHRGKAIDGPVEVVVFYAGAVGVPNTVVADSPEGLQYCKQ